MEENMVVIRDPKTFYFNFHWPKDVDENLKQEIEFIITRNEFLAKNKIKSNIEKLLLKFKHGNNIHEYTKQQIERAKFFLSLSQILDLRISNKDAALQNLSICYT